MTYALMLSTVAASDQAEMIADHLVSHHLAACVNIVPSVKSVYRWKGEVTREQEVLLLIKTEQACVPQVEKAIREIHPYENPELIALTLDYGKSEYLEWITDSLKKRSSGR